MYSRIVRGPLRPLGALLASGLLLAAVACSHSHTISTSDGKVTFTGKGKDGATVVVAGKDGKSASLTLNQNKVPDDYPKDLPVYSPATVVMAQSTSDQNAHSLMLESPDSSDAVVAFYKKSLEGNGWKTESTMTTPQLTLLTATKEQRKAVLQITDNGSKRSVMQVVSDKK